ncbi:helix-turn-helix domain-containing protein [Atopobiaceae bacterium 24-176]
MNFNDAFAAKLRGKRAEADITQSELAEFLGVSSVSVFRWEDGVTVPNFKTVYDLAEVLGCTPNDLCPAPEEVA